MTQFAMQLKETVPKFDAMGLFYIDGTLVYSVGKFVSKIVHILNLK